MADQKSMLCVGGPHDGRRMAILHGNGFCVPIMEDTPRDVRAEDFQPNARASIRFVDYRAEIFTTPQGEVSFWVPKEQTLLETITRLLTVYESALGKPR